MGSDDHIICLCCLREVEPATPCFLDVATEDSDSVGVVFICGPCLEAINGREHVMRGIPRSAVEMAREAFMTVQMVGETNG